jgi:predicted Zn-dependent peptidase
VAVSCSVNEDCVSLVLTSDPEELGTALELLSLLLGEPELEAPALTRWQAAMLDERLGHVPGLEERLAVTVLELLTGSDPRFAPLLPERAAAIERAAAQRWLDEVLGEAPVEVAVVAPAPRGDLEAAAVRYLRAPLRRPAHRPELEPLRRLAAPESAVAAEITVPSDADRAAVMAGWRGLPYRDSEARASLHMAVQLLNRRLHRELREERGLTYDPDCSFSPSRAYPAASLLSATFYAAPDRVEEAIAASHRVFEELATHGPTEAEMASVRAQFAELAARAERDPRFWARTLAEARYRNLDLASLDDLPGRCRRRSSDQLQEVLARCIRPDRRLTVVCRTGGA